MDSADLGPAMSLHYAGQSANKPQGYLVRMNDNVAALFPDCAEIMVSGDGGLTLLDVDGKFLAAFATGCWKSVCRQVAADIQ